MEILIAYAIVVVLGILILGFATGVFKIEFEIEEARKGEKFEFDIKLEKRDRDNDSW